MQGKKNSDQKKCATGWAVCVYVACPLGLGKPGCCGGREGNWRPWIRLSRCRFLFSRDPRKQALRILTIDLPQHVFRKSQPRHFTRRLTGVTAKCDGFPAGEEIP